MSTKHLRVAYEKQVGESWSEMKERVHKALPDDRKDEEWRDALRSEILKSRLSIRDVIEDVVWDVQKTEKNTRNFTPPGQGDQLDIFAMTKESLASSVVIISEDESIRADKAKAEHWMLAQQSRLQEANEKVQAAMRMTEITKMAMEKGGLAGALRRQGVEGW